MKILYSILLLLAFFNNNAAQPAKKIPGDEIIGVYWSPKKDGKIEIFRNQNKYFGKLVWGKKPRKDVHNPNTKLRDRELIGMIFLSDFSFNDNEYINGNIYDPESGKNYKSKMWLENGNLRLRGFVGFSFLGRTETFEKVR